MPRIAAIIPLCLLLAAASVAAAHDPAAPVDGEVKIVVTKADCRRVVKHAPAPDVIYRPGLDMNGDPVVPADLDGGVRIELPERFTIPMEVDLFDRFGIPADEANFRADLLVGEVFVDRYGRAYFNGQPLQNEAAAELAAKCQKILRDDE